MTRCIFSKVPILVLTWLGCPLDLHASAKIGAAVADVLSRSGKADVMIALEPAVRNDVRPVELAKLREAVATVQDGFLARLDPGDFQLRRRFQSVPALAGRILTESGLKRAAADPFVLRIDLDVGGTGGLAETVPLIGADLRHADGNRGAGIVIAVIDSGADTDHQDLQAGLVHEECFLDDDGMINGAGLCPNGSDRQSGPGAAEDDAGHGTHVTGIVNSRGIRSPVGVAPDASVVSIKVTAGPSFSGVFYYFSELVAALDFIIGNPGLGIRVINMSLVTGARFDGDCDNSTAYNMAGAAAVNTLRDAGVITFASSGNNSSGTQMASPACLSNVVSVGATNKLDGVASFTDSNASTDIMAPGVSVLSDGLSNATTTASGTSMASPHAAACAALLLESGEAGTPDQIEARLKTSPVSVTDETNGLSFPRISCFPGDPPAAMTVTKQSGTRLVTTAGEVVPYIYVLRNTGRVTLHDVVLMDENVDESPVCNFTGNDELAAPPSNASSVVCTARHTVTPEEIEAGGTLDNTATATSDETEPVLASLSIPIGIFADGFERDACPCWTAEDISSLPVPGAQAECVASATRTDLAQVDVCEHSYGVSFSGAGAACYTNRYDCPDLTDLGVQREIDDDAFYSCLDQVRTRCEELGIEPPPFP